MRKFGRGKTVQIAELFASYKNNLKAPQKTVVQAVIEVIGDLLNITLKEDEVRYSPTNRTVTMSVRGPIHSEIRMQKKEILNHLKGRLGEKSAPKEIL